MTTLEAMIRLREDEDFVFSKRYDYSLAKVLEKFPDGAPDRVVAAALMITQEDVQKIYNDIVERLQAKLVDPSL